MAEYVYLLCAALSILVAWMLYRQYRRVQTHLLFWSCLCFAGFALNNIILVVDLVVFPDFDFNGYYWRNLLAAISGSLLLFGLIWELS